MRRITIVDPHIKTPKQFRTILETTLWAHTRAEKYRQPAVEALYVSAPALETRGTWKMVQMVSDRELAEMAQLYSLMTNGRGWE